MIGEMLPDWSCQCDDNADDGDDKIMMMMSKHILDKM